MKATSLAKHEMAFGPHPIYITNATTSNPRLNRILNTDALFFIDFTSAGMASAQISTFNFAG
jgi:hypothetical protein